MQEIASQKIPNTIHGCIVESHESTRQRVESSLGQNMKIAFAGKGFTSMTHYNLFHKFIPMPQAIKIPDAKAAVVKELKKVRDNSGMDKGKVKSKKEGIIEAQRDKKKVHFAALMDICHFKDAELERESCSVVTL